MGRRIVIGAVAAVVLATPGLASAAGSGVTVRVNDPYNGGNANDDSTRDSLSENGAYATFESKASDLVPGDDNGTYDVFYVDKHDPSGTITLVSRAAGSTHPANAQSNFSDVSGNGAVVVFDSEATDVVSGGNHAGGVFVRYLKDDPGSGNKAGHVEQVDVTPSGGQPSGTSGRPTISQNGRYVVFNSNAADLAPGVKHAGDIYVRDLWKGVTERVTYSSTGGAVNGPSFRAQISSNGARIAYQSQASNIDGSVDDSNHTFDIYVSPNPFTISGTPHGVLASVTPGGSAGGGQRPGMSGNGRYVAFQSNSALAQPATAGVTNVYRRDLVGRSTLVMSRRYDGTAAGANSTRGVLDYAGDVGAFVSGDTRIIAHDRNGQRDVFIRKLPVPSDPANGPALAVSVDATTGEPADTCSSSSATPSGSAALPLGRPGADDISTRPVLSSNGLSVAFVSSLCNLEEGVRNDGTRNDVYVRTYSSSPF